MLKADNVKREEKGERKVYLNPGFTTPHHLSV